MKGQIGKPIETEQLLEIFRPEDGSIDIIYGRIGMGKTYAATADILKDLARGIVVYANWHVDFSGFDERTDFLSVLLGVFGLKRNFYNIDSSNFHKIELDDEFMEQFENIVDAKVYLDEGHIIFDSYQHAKFSMRKRKAILHTRHFNRSIIIVTQRPTAIHVSARANVNRFFKVERWIKWPVLLFTKTEYQDMINETVDEEKPLSTKFYFGSRRILNAYNSKYMRGGIPRSSEAHIEGFSIPYFRRWQLLFRYFSKNNTYAQDIHSAGAASAAPARDTISPMKHVSRFLDLTGKRYSRNLDS